MFVDVLLNVLAIMGIIVAGGFLVFFLGDLVISIVDGKNSTVFESKRKNSESERPLMNEDMRRLQQPTTSPYFSTTEKEDFAKSGTLELATNAKNDPNYASRGWKDIDEEQARIEKMMLENSNCEKQPVAAEKATTEKMGAIVKPSSDKSSSIDDLRREEEEFKKKRLEEAAKRQNESVFPKQTATKDAKNDDNLDFGDLFFDDAKTEETDEDNVDFEALLAELTSKSEKNTPSKDEALLAAKKEEEEENLNAFLSEEEPATENAETVNAVSEETISETEKVSEEEKVEVEEDERDKVRAELEALKEILAEKEKENSELKQRASVDSEKSKSDIFALQSALDKAKLEQDAKANEPTIEPLLSEDEYVNMIERLTKTLKINEKELKSVKREFLPLARVRKSLDNDKKKLRRKEAMVAKQKVVLYGVNNYVDIDEDKAKQLAEDLDLLDGLKLSVEHCESVMEQNKERYPLLENTFRVLKNTNEALKNDVADLNEQLAKLRLRNGN